MVSDRPGPIHAISFDISVSGDRPHFAAFGQRALRMVLGLFGARIGRPDNPYASLLGEVAISARTTFAKVMKLMSSSAAQGTPNPPRQNGSTINEQISDERLLYIEIWKKAVDTQMHFNEMSVKARQFGLTFVAAALGLGVALLTRKQDPVLPVNAFGVHFQIHAIVLLVFASALALYAVKQLDLRVYHKMLRGAVAFGEDFEENYMKKIFSLEKGMTQAISHFSRHENAAIDKDTAPYRYRGGPSKTASDKVSWFYTVSIGTLVVVGALLFLATSHFSATCASPHPYGQSTPLKSSAH